MTAVRSQSRILGILFICVSIIKVNAQDSSPWILIDDFESLNPLENWTLADTRNDSSPRIENPQVTEVRVEENKQNHYLIKKPAPDGIVGNRKALS